MDPLRPCQSASASARSNTHPTHFNTPKKLQRKNHPFSSNPLSHPSDVNLIPLYASVPFHRTHRPLPVAQLPLFPSRPAASLGLITSAGESGSVSCFGCSALFVELSGASCVSSCGSWYGGKGWFWYCLCRAGLGRVEHMRFSHIMPFSVAAIMDSGIGWMSGLCGVGGDCWCCCSGKYDGDGVECCGGGCVCGCAAWMLIFCFTWNQWMISIELSRGREKGG